MPVMRNWFSFVLDKVLDWLGLKIDETFYQLFDRLAAYYI